MTYQTTNDFNITRQDGTYTGTTGELVVSDGGTITLPTPAAGEKFGVRALRNDVTLLSNGSIEASTGDRRIISEGNSVFVSDGTEWYLVSGNEYFGFDIPDSALTQDLVAWYRFEDGDARDYTHDLNATFADTTAYDGIVDGATFQSSGGVTDFENGANSGAFDFDGSNDFITTSSSDNLSPTPITVMGWINPDSTSSGEGGFGKWNLKSIQTDGSYLIRTDVGTNTYEINITNEDGSQIAAGDVGTLNANTWDHLAFSHDGTSLRRYFNGSYEYQTTENYNIGSSNVNLRFGLHDDSSFFGGQLDDIRIYNTVLSDSEINNIYNATKP